MARKKGAESHLGAHPDAGRRPALARFLVYVGFVVAVVLLWLYA
ncbi:MAG: hypothetical protein R6U10_07920 [Thermoplasmatota archaeon]